MTTEWVLQQFHPQESKAQIRYEQFVNDGIGKRPWDDLKGQIFLGSEAFIQDLQDHGIGSPEIPEIQRQPLRPTLSVLLETDQGLLEAYWKYGYRIYEIAAQTNVHYTSVSRRLKELKMQQGIPA